MFVHITSEVFFFSCLSQLKHNLSFTETVGNAQEIYASHVKEIRELHIWEGYIFAPENTEGTLLVNTNVQCSDCIFCMKCRLTVSGEGSQSCVLNLNLTQNILQNFL